MCHDVIQPQASSQSKRAVLSLAVSPGVMIAVTSEAGVGVEGAGMVNRRNNKNRIKDCYIAMLSYAGQKFVGDVSSCPKTKKLYPKIHAHD